MENKQTAVAWLEDQIFARTKFIDIDLFQVIEQAKEMEKSQIVDAYKNGKWECDKIVMSDKFYGKQYYEEVYGNEDDLPDWDVTLNDGLPDEE
jgi:hypothetical protein